MSDAATALQDKANNEGASDLATKAEHLATAAEKLATSNSGQASDNADSVITKFELLEGAYDKLGTSSPTNQSKVEKEFKTVKHIYDRMLNVTKATLLQGEVGNGSSDDKLRALADALHTKANDLAHAGELSDQEDLKKLATALATAVGANEGTGLQQALKDLKTANKDDPKDLIPKAKEVITKYNAVKEAFGKVTAKSTQYESALSGGETEKYIHVTSAFDNLKSNFDEVKSVNSIKAITPIYDKPLIR